MKTLWEFLAQFWRQLRPWVIVNPWEQAIRVRLGSHQRRLGPGIHLKLPMLDSVFAQSVRRRIVGLQTQTVTTNDGKTATFSGSLSYEIVDIVQLYQTLHHAEDTIVRLGMAALATAVRVRSSNDCNQQAIEQEAKRELKLERFGLNGADLYLTDFAVVRTYRLISDPRYGIVGDALNTNQEHGA